MCCRGRCPPGSGVIFDQAGGGGGGGLCLPSLSCCKCKQHGWRPGVPEPLHSHKLSAHPAPRQRTETTVQHKHTAIRHAGPAVASSATETLQEHMQWAKHRAEKSCQHAATLAVHGTRDLSPGKNSWARKQLVPLCVDLWRAVWQVRRPLRELPVKVT